MNRAHDAERRETRFLLAAQEFDLAPDRVLRHAEESGPVRGVANRSRRNRANVGDPHRVAEHAETLKRADGFADAFVGQEAGCRDPCPETAERLFVESWRRRPGMRFVSDKTD